MARWEGEGPIDPLTPKLGPWPGAAILGLLLASLAVLAKIFFDAPLWRYSADSAAYIEQARSLMSLGRPLITPPELYPLTRPDEPSQLFPVGFPLVLAGLGQLGVDPREGALLANGAAAVALPWLLFAAFRRTMGALAAFAIAIYGALSPGVLAHASAGLTDNFTLALAAIVIGMVLNARSTALFALAGFIAGFAYDVRNAYVVLSAAVAGFMAWRWWGQAGRRWPVFWRASAFGVGALGAVGPVLVLNLLSQGSINPYEMAPSTIGLVENTRRYLHEILFDLTALFPIAHSLAWTLAGLALLFGLLLGFAALVVRGWPGADTGAKKVLVLCGLYAALSATLVVVARSRYEWGDLINLRYTMQATPFAFAAIVAGLQIAIGKARLTQGWPRRAAFAAFGLLALSQALFQARSWGVDDPANHLARHAADAGEEHLCGQPGPVLLVSNWADLSQISCGARTRWLRPVERGGADSGEALITALDRLDLESWSHQTVVALYPDFYAFKAEAFPLPRPDQARLEAAGWRFRQNDAQGLVMARPSLDSPENSADQDGASGRPAQGERQASP